MFGFIINDARLSSWAKALANSSLIGFYQEIGQFFQT
jgi:hypothetical protein